ncbi:PqiB family protein [Dickeya solani]|uniref:MlaD family protein n=1 Tax=Dickeya solani TaxID=1089444 RepID=A0ABU4EAM1_9GAMM|nr:MlaD family protein [Dickeya solani]MCA6998899.1 MlaD family protein [Dickeya solani]MCZ0822350.1 MlaD family protein [Dickeya solani]MDV6994551.1 MlaD family protein [Dickeya solani]MDV7003930.1 MlaD family protein [Dickeya solani]MDV7039899.1 MlaD family protein [Dickeya solani]
MNPMLPGEITAIRRHWRHAFIWLVPVIALAISLAMLVQSRLSAGPDITLSFRSATGLEAGKTTVKYKDVTVGVVKDIVINDDGSRVLVRVQLNKNAENLARSGSRFWVVRPRVGMSGVSGIDTLLSGAYIGVDKGYSSETRREFTGLETPPAIINDMPGSHFVIDADDLGSLDIGSPVYYRRVQVGRLASYHLKEDGRGVSLQVFIDAPYDRLVQPDTRFWNVSGVDLSVGANGFRLKTQTVAAVLAGGIAFAAPESNTEDNTESNKDSHKTPAINPPVSYRLAQDQESAMSAPDGQAIPFRLRFERALHGLDVGAPVEFSSVTIGRVTAISLDYNPTGYRFPTIVDVEVYPARLGNLLDKLPGSSPSEPPSPAETVNKAAQFTRDLVAHGLRAQAVPGNLLTGQLYVSFDFVPDAPSVLFNPNTRPIELPTVSGGLDKLQAQLGSIVAKVNNMPLESIGNNLNNTLVELNKTLRLVNNQTLPTANSLMKQTQLTTENAQELIAEDSPLLIHFTQTLQETSRTLRTLREFTEQLERNPESLLRGRSSDSALDTADGHPASLKGKQP